MLGRAAAYLRSHDVCNFELHASALAPWDLVHDEFLDRTDLVVAGIHSKKFLVDPFVGSFTRKLIDTGRVSLFLSH